MLRDQPHKRHETWRRYHESRDVVMRKDGNGEVLMEHEIMVADLLGILREHALVEITHEKGVDTDP
jgi:hypothetical protein